MSYDGQSYINTGQGYSLAPNSFITSGSFPKPINFSRQTALDFAIKSGAANTLETAEAFYQFLTKE